MIPRFLGRPFANACRLRFRLGRLGAVGCVGGLLLAAPAASAASTPQHAVIDNVTFPAGAPSSRLGRHTLTTQGATTVPSGAPVQFQAGQRITLGPGFSVQTGGLFQATIAPVDTDRDGVSDDNELLIGFDPDDPADIPAYRQLFADSVQPGLWRPLPAWWITRNLITTGAVADDYAAANLGQLKHVATQAAATLGLALRSSGGAGAEINALITSWQQPAAAGVARDDYAVLNQGQLKAVADLFYKRLNEVGYKGVPLRRGQTRPWSASTDDDAAYAAVNLGQLKFMFSFVPLAGVLVDSDQDGIDDRWEVLNFDQLTTVKNPTHVVIGTRVGDYDGDGFSDLEEFLLGTDPKVANTQVAPGDAILFQYDNRARLRNATGQGVNATYTPDAENNLK